MAVRQSGGAMTLNSIACKGVIEVSPRFPMYVTIARVAASQAPRKLLTYSFSRGAEPEVPTEQPIFSMEDLGRGSAV
jgi:hypothetical protein